MHRDSNSPRLVRNRAGNRLTNPPRRICAELKAFMVVKFFHSLYQAEVALLNQVEKEHAASYIPFRNTDNKPQVRLRKLLFCFLVAFLHAQSKLDFLLRAQQRHLADFFQVHPHRVVNIDALWQSQVEILLNLLLGFNIAQYVNPLAFEVFINAVYAVRIQVQIRQMIYDLLIFQYTFFLFAHLDKFLQTGQ